MHPFQYRIKQIFVGNSHHFLSSHLFSVVLRFVLILFLSCSWTMFYTKRSYVHVMDRFIHLLVKMQKKCMFCTCKSWHVVYASIECWTFCKAAELMSESDKRINCLTTLLQTTHSYLLQTMVPLRHENDKTFIPFPSIFSLCFSANKFNATFTNLKGDSFK